jgi:hypothetical protein
MSSVKPSHMNDVMNEFLSLALALTLSLALVSLPLPLLFVVASLYVSHCSSPSSSSSKTDSKSPAMAGTSVGFALRYEIFVFVDVLSLEESPLTKSFSAGDTDADEDIAIDVIDVDRRAPCDDNIDSDEKPAQDMKSKENTSNIGNDDGDGSNKRRIVE